MLTATYRPRNFTELVGQDINVDLLKAVVKSPEDSPRLLFLSGAYGTGKTSAARIFARALNCTQGKRGDSCGECENCTVDQDFSPYYQEYDSSEVGSKEAIEELKDDFLASTPSYPWRVVVLDEFHLTSRQAQAALLKITESMPERLFLVLCTTNPEKVLSTLKNRALDLVFHPVGQESMHDLLVRVAAAEGIEIRSALVDYLAVHSRGHVRTGVMLLDLYKSLEDKRSILEHLRSVEQDLLALLVAVRQGDREIVAGGIARVCQAPLATLRTDLYRVIQQALKVYATGDTEDLLYPEEHKALANLYRGDLLKLLGFSMSEWAVNCFDDDVAVQSFFWALFLTFGKKEKKGSEGQAAGSRFRKRGA